jgi:tetratricopeptide (TPR) repeat protein
MVDFQYLQNKIKITAMKKILFGIFLLLFFNSSFSQEVKLMPAQENEVRTLIGSYYNYLQQWADKLEPEVLENINPLFTHKAHARVYDDLVTDKITGLLTYLNEYYKLRDEGIKISLSENIQNVPIKGFTTEEIVKSNGVKVAVTVLTKHTKGNKIIKEAPNTFVINLEKKTIAKIVKNEQDLYTSLAQNSQTVESSVAEANTEMLGNILDGWYMDAILLYNMKKYEEALSLFEKAASRGHMKSQYEAGVMYFLKKGCNKLKKKEREEQGYKWLIKAAEQLPEGSRYNKARQTLDALGYY